MRSIEWLDPQEAAHGGKVQRQPCAWRTQATIELTVACIGRFEGE